MTPEDLLRVYLDPSEITTDGPYAGYPKAWHMFTPGTEIEVDGELLLLPVKDYIRFLAGHRCERCGHPFVVGETPGEWSPCDEQCTHGGPIRTREAHLSDDAPWRVWGSPGDTPAVAAGDWIYDDGPGGQRIRRWDVEAQWRVLTTHHLNGIKADLRWWNLASLCQRCHLSIQAKVWMNRPWNKAHTKWFQLHAAGFYAWKYLDQELTREQTMMRAPELLALEMTQDALW